jgi:DNA-binding transcriptional ArsR family regulator
MPRKEPENDLLIDTTTLKKAALLFRAVNNAVRLRILTLLHREKKMAVTPIYRTLKMEQSVASQQLAILRRAGIVHAEREQRQIFYSVNYARLEELNRVAKHLLN